jgi:hypothetical protein
MTCLPIETLLYSSVSVQVFCHYILSHFGRRRQSFLQILREKNRENTGMDRRLPGVLFAGRKNTEWGGIAGCKTPLDLLQYKIGLMSGGKRGGRP